MPYRIEGRSVMVKRGDRWVTLKTHPTREAALAHFRALQANVEHGKRKRETSRVKRQT
jgi:hypothetical protein